MHQAFLALVNALRFVWSIYPASGDPPGPEDPAYPLSPVQDQRAPVRVPFPNHSVTVWRADQRYIMIDIRESVIAWRDPVQGEVDQPRKGSRQYRRTSCSYWCYTMLSAKVHCE